MFDDELSDADDTGLAGRGVSMLAVILPFTATILSLMIGVAIGGMAGWMSKPTPTAIEHHTDRSLAELEEICEPVVEEKTTQLAEVKSQIAELRLAVKEREQQIADLQAAKKQRRTGSGATSREVERLKEEVAEAKLQIAQLQEEKRQLVTALTETANRLAKTEEDLRVQINLTEIAKDDASANKWFRFVNRAQLDICEKGNRKKLGACRESVTDLMQPQLRRKFQHCVRSGQAVPSVHELGKNEEMPEYSYFLNEDDKVVRGWYIQLCDPTLPENDGVLASMSGPRF